MNPLPLALGSMLVQQTFATLCKVYVPALAPAIVIALGVPDSYNGLFVALHSLAAIVSMLACGGLIRRSGAMRISQLALVIMGGALMLTASGRLLPIAFAALLLGASVAVSTPASSQILSAHSPRRWAPLIFSVKQMGVPFGILLAMTLGPLLEASLGWRGALLVVVAAVLVLALLLNPLRPLFDTDIRPDSRIGFGDAVGTVRAVLGDPAIRSLALGAFAFVGLQSIFTNFFTLYFTRALGFSLTEAGYFMAVAIAISAGGRVLWGWVASRIMPPRRVLALLAFVMCAASFVFGRAEAGWGDAALVASAVAVGLSAVSWHGVLLSEVARLAPLAEVGRYTGGVLAFGSLAQTIFPLIFSAALAFGDSYTLGFHICGVPAALAGAMFLFGRGDR